MRSTGMGEYGVDGERLGGQWGLQRAGACI